MQQRQQQRHSHTGSAAERIDGPHTPRLAALPERAHGESMTMLSHPCEYASESTRRAADIAVGRQRPPRSQQQVAQTAHARQGPPRFQPPANDPNGKSRPTAISTASVGQPRSQKQDAETADVRDCFTVEIISHPRSLVCSLVSRLAKRPSTNPQASPSQSQSQSPSPSQIS